MTKWKVLNRYQQEGYENRDAYLRGMAEQYGVSVEKTLLLADLLGPEEDFDGFIMELDGLADYEM